MIVVLVPVGILAVIVAYAALTAYGHRFEPQSMVRPIRLGLGRVRHRLRRAGPGATSTASGLTRAAASTGTASATRGGPAAGGRRARTGGCAPAQPAARTGPHRRPARPGAVATAGHILRDL